MQEIMLSSMLKIEAQVPSPPRLNDYMSRCYGLGNPGATAQCRRQALRRFSQDAKAWSQRYETPGNGNNYYQQEYHRRYGRDGSYQQHNQQSLQESNCLASSVPCR